MSRREYEMSQKWLDELLEASKPVPAMYLSGGQPMFEDPRTKANRVWARLADDYGFVWDSVRPVPGKPYQFFTAEPKA